MDENYRQAAVRATLDVLQRNFVSPDRVAECVTSLETHVAKEYAARLPMDRIIERYTQDLKRLCADKHFGISLRPKTSDGNALDQSQWRSSSKEYQTQRQPNFGISRAQVLDGNIGLVELIHFRAPEFSTDTLTAALTMVANSRATILDLRQNRGGSPAMVAKVASYFFAQPTHHSRPL